jgi:hypothetical protein
MKREVLIKGFLIKPIFEILKKDYKIKSPSPSNFYITKSKEGWSIKYIHNKSTIDFSDNEMVKDLLIEIKNNVLYEKVQL